ncbi:ABC transporter permease [Niastella sp. OAS944]|uniref:ABC transporter permease n=1 Tax=Niastella sp. OAS944 TaxID=2664089 RepID=UPI003485FDC7|nr:NitT/TauT family transport system permease protein [Chitinophagaceae bacterium OAS944]
MKKIFQPFATINRQTILTMVAMQVVITLMLWHTLCTGLIPKPTKVAAAFVQLLGSKLLLDNILVSLLLTLKAMLYSIIITLLFAYLSVLPFFKSVAQFIVKCRYLTLTGLIFIFTLLTNDGSGLKLSLLVFGIVPFFVTSFLAVIVQIDQQEYELCKTLGYNNWQTLYEVIIIGKADQVFEILRQNFAISWLMITMVEGLSMSEGGIGTLLIKYNKYNDLTNVLALQLVIFIIGLLFDYLLGAVRQWLFPYSRLKKAKAL